MKVNLTARNLPTHLNNFVANIGLQSVRRGRTPAGIIADLTNSHTTWTSYRNGTLRKTNPRLYLLCREIERSGLIDSTVMDAEFGITGVGHESLRALNKKITGKETPLQDFYKWGDNVFKLDETIRNTQHIDDAIVGLSDGEWIKLQVSPVAKDFFYIEKTPDGWKTYSKNKKGELRDIKNVTDLNDPGMSKMIVDAAKQAAQELFFDYSDISNFGKMVRTAPLIGVVSPFFSWFWKALDIPFVKKGLISKTIEGIGPIKSTNSARIKANMGADAAGLAARRAFVTNGFKATVLDRPESELADFMKRVPKDIGIVLVDNLTDPRYLGTSNWEAANYGASTDMLWRGMWSAYAATLEPEDIFPRLPDGTLDTELTTVPDDQIRDMKKRQALFTLNKSGQLWDGTDFLQLIGLSGSPIVDTMTMIETSIQQERPVELSEVYRRFGSALIGGVAHSAIDIAAGYADPTSHMSTREWALTDDTKEGEAFLRWAIRRITKLGFVQKRLAPKGDKLIGDIERTFKASMNRVHDDRREDYLRLAKEAKGEKKAEYERESALLKKKMIRNNEIIKNEMKKIRAEFKETSNRIR